MARAAERRVRTIARFGAALALAGAASACARDADPVPSPPAGDLAALADRYWEWYLAWHPLEATFLGEHAHDGRVPDISAAGRADRRAQVGELVDALERIDPDSLGPADRLTYLALAQGLSTERAAQVCEPETWRVDHREGIQLAFLNVVSAHRIDTPEQGEDMIERWYGMADYLDDYVSNLRTGLETGRVAPRVAVSRTIAQLDDLLERPVEEWPLYAPAGANLDPWPESSRRRFRDEIRTAVSERVRPAYIRLRDFLRDEVFPRARAGTEAGLSGLPGGEACYRAMIRDQTSLDRDPKEIHDLGRAELDRIQVEIRDLGERALGTPDLSEIQRRLREDPSMHFRWPGEIIAAAEAAHARAEREMPDWFGLRPKAEFVVRPIPMYEAPQSIVAYYRQPAPDGSRPGTYYVNTYRPEIRPRYQSEVLTFHEGIPGHHLQTTIAQQVEDIPVFRRHLGSTAFKEGWALYAERLADEMGLYSGDLDRLGLLSYEAWRASRLIVDTGLHALGWSRDRAVAFLRDNTLLAEANIENEVDRYLTSPAQALTYKLGQLEILALRQEARTRLGDEFRISDFHDRVLENGALPLGALREAVENWIGTSEGGVAAAP